MKNHTETPARTAPKKPGGRPRSAENTELVASLIAKQDAMAARVAARIAEILRTHVSLEGATIVWRRICRDARARFERLPAEACARLPNLGEADRAVLEAEIAAILDEMDGGTDDGAPLPTLAPEEEPPTVKSSSTLAQARAQLARLQTYLMRLKARIVRDDPWVKTRILNGKGQ